MKEKQKRRSSKGGILITILAWCIAIVAVCAVLGIAVWKHMTKPLATNEAAHEIQVRIPQGMSVRDVSKELEDLGIIRSGIFFYAAVRYGIIEDFTLKSGFYSLSDAMTFKEIAAVLQSGTPEYISVSIPEGLTARKIANLLQEASVCSAEDFLKACTSYKLLEEYRIPSQSFEGYLFPDTYFFSINAGAEKALRKMVDTFFYKVSSIEELQNKAPEELYHTVILASIVEREYRIADEAKLIASVFTNRLSKNQALESCATVEYIITEVLLRPHPERILYADLEIDNPYNTYKYAGLPPGPISNPGLVSLTAAAHPAESDYLYFVLTNAEKGEHTFTYTFDQHKAAQSAGYVTKKAP